MSYKPFRHYTQVLGHMYSLGGKNSYMFEFPSFLPPTNLGLPMHSSSALTEHVTLNLARFILLDPVHHARKRTKEQMRYTERSPPQV